MDAPLEKSLTIGITGVSGFVGRRVAELAKEAGHAVVGFSRNPSRMVPGCSSMRAFTTDAPLDVDGLDAMIHLAGESVLGIWTRAKQRRIRQSRILGTRAVVDGIAAAASPPGVLVSASAVGIYGDTADRKLDEQSAVGSGFLAEVATAWEEEARQAETAGTRVAMVRIGFVLGAGGGAAPILGRVFGLALGGRFGNGRQWMPPVHVDDVAGILLFAVENKAASGPLNACMPEPCTNGKFTRAVAKHVGRPAFFHVPAFVLRFGLGKFSQLFLMSLRILPTRTLDLGYAFRHPTLDGALADVMGPGRETDSTN